MPTIDLLTLAGLPDAADPAWSQWLTPAELLVCRGYVRGKEHLAARLAGKLALAREAGLDAAPWHEVEISQGYQQPPELFPPDAVTAVFGSAAVPTLSLAHAGGYAAALAWCPAEDEGAPW